MQETLVGLHSLWRWVVLLAVTVAIIRTLIGWLRRGDWTDSDNLLRVVAINALNVQVALGIVIWLIQRRWDDGVFLGIIHPLVMLAALGIASVGSARARRATEPVVKHRTLALSLIATMFLVTAAIPSDSWSRAWRG